MPDIERRRAAAAAAWHVGNAVVLVAAGDEIPVPGRGDRTYPFRAHSEYLWLTDRERPGGVIAYDPGEGWLEFVVPVTADELLWTGLEGDSEGVPEGTRPLRRAGAFVGDRPIRKLGATAEPDVVLRERLIRARRPKDDVEVERMRKAAEATRAGFAALVPLIAPGRTERELQVALDAAFLSNGGDFLSFETIVAAGDHSAVLHFAPTQRDVAARPAPARRRRRRAPRLRERRHAHVCRRRRVHARQRIVWETVRRAVDAAIAACRPGVEWRDVHRTAALVTPRAWSSSASCAARRTRSSRAAPSRCSSRTASATWSDSAFATPASRPTRRATPRQACRDCGSTSRCRRATAGPSSPGSTSSRRCSPASATPRRRLGARRRATRLRRRPDRAERAHHRGRLRRPHRRHPAVITAAARPSCPACRPRRWRAAAPPRRAGSRG